jgi:hypothetical protein
MDVFVRSRRNFLKTMAGLIVSGGAASHGKTFASNGVDPALQDSPKVIVVLCGGIRRRETFEEAGFANIPHLYGDLLPKSLFYPFVRNAGVTSHFNTISSILTGNWQRLDDWGKTAPESPTVFEHLRRERGMPEDSAWFISSNKALTNRIGASSVPTFGPRYGANVIFPKQLLIDAVVDSALHGRASHSTDRKRMQPELEAMLEANNYEGMGWSVSGSSSLLDESTRKSVLRAIDDLVNVNAAATGDEFTFLVAVEIMRRFAPSLLVITFSDVEAAHFGSYSMHLAGIRTMDRLIYELWDEVNANLSYKGKTTLFVLPEFGRDLDGSVTNGFFNHRQDDESTRLTWMMCLGEGAEPGIAERQVLSVDVCPTILRAFGLKLQETQGKVLKEVSL